ncbi:hypothetical protein B0H14DRAFT_2575738 [Mycena olivaceomarginata]|nr:hypothetical protein B0H14DRAFT_2575738 [Mycena olivaceomarginata]
MFSYEYPLSSMDAPLMVEHFVSIFGREFPHGTWYQQQRARKYSSQAAQLLHTSDGLWSTWRNTSSGWERIYIVYMIFTEAYRLPQAFEGGVSRRGRRGGRPNTHCVTDLSLLGSQAERALDQIIVRIRAAQKDGIWAWDSELNELVLINPTVLAVLGNNPMQKNISAELAG